MSKAIKRRKKKAAPKRRTKNPSKAGRTVKPKAKRKPLKSKSAPRSISPRRSAKTAGDHIKSARALLEVEIGKAEGRVMAAKRKSDRNKHLKRLNELRSQYRKLVTK